MVYFEANGQVPLAQLWRPCSNHWRMTAPSSSAAAFHGCSCVEQLCRHILSATAAARGCLEAATTPGLFLSSSPRQHPSPQMTYFPGVWLKFKQALVRPPIHGVGHTAPPPPSGSMAIFLVSLFVLVWVRCVPPPAPTFMILCECSS